MARHRPCCTPTGVTAETDFVIFDSRALPCGTDGRNGVVWGSWDYAKLVQQLSSCYWEFGKRRVDFNRQLLLKLHVRLQRFRTIILQLLQCLLMTKYTMVTTEHRPLRPCQTTTGMTLRYRITRVTKSHNDLL